MVIDCNMPKALTWSTFSEDELVSLDELQEKVAELEDFVQSTDIAAMQSESRASKLNHHLLTKFNQQSSKS